MNIELTQEVLDLYLTKDIIVKYESIRKSGVCNMITEQCDVMEILWPDMTWKESYPYYSLLQQNFSDLKLMYNIDDNTILPEFKREGNMSYSFE